MLSRKTRNQSLAWVLHLLNNMKTYQTILFVAFIMVVVFLAGPSEAVKKQVNIMRLEHIQILAEITHDLNEDTPVLFRPHKGNDALSCLCVCRDGLWSCTTPECKVQGDSCMNPEWDDDEINLRKSPAFEPYSMLESDDSEQ